MCMCMIGVSVCTKETKQQRQTDAERWRAKLLLRVEMGTHHVVIVAGQNLWAQSATGPPAEAFTRRCMLKLVQSCTKLGSKLQYKISTLASKTDNLLTTTWEVHGVPCTTADSASQALHCQFQIRMVWSSDAPAVPRQSQVNRHRFSIRDCGLESSTQGFTLEL